MTPMLRFLLRKMWNNRWLTLSSWAGLALAVSFTVSIPVYKEGAMMRTIAASLAEAELGDGASPGAMLIKYQAPAQKYTTLEELRDTDAYISDKVPEQVGYPRTADVRTWSLRSRTIVPDDESRRTDGRRRQMSVTAQTGLSGAVDLTGGTGWSAAGIASDGAIEALVWEDALLRGNMTVGETYRYEAQTRSGTETFRIRIVGSFRPKDERSDYWYHGADAMAGVFYVAEQVFDNLIDENKANVSEAGWFGVFDLNGVRPHELSGLERTLSRLEPELFAILPQTRVEIGFADLIADFRVQSVRLETSLFILAAPMLAIVFFYIVMNARQALSRQRTDIAVLRSRGGTRAQLARLFLYEGLLLGAPALAAGFAGGRLMAAAIGSTDGFLRFVTGKQLALSYPPEALLYGTVAVAAGIAASALPAWRYAGTSIVANRQEQARSDRAPLWQRLYLDLALLAAAAYGWYLLDSRSKLVSSLGAGGGASGPEAPAYLFYIPAFAVFAAGLVFLRAFPPAVRLLHAAGGRRMPVAMHLALLSLARSVRSAYPLMLLLILTLGLGSYHAAAARTIDANADRALAYEGGGDAVVRTVWEGYEDSYDEEGNLKEEGESVGVIYTEPPFEAFRGLPGVSHAAKVLKEEVDLATASKPAGKGTLMGIQNSDFARSASFTEDIYAIHPFRYLSLLGAYEQAALVSESFAATHGLKPGDTLQLTVRGTRLDFIIVGLVPYWPTLDPNEAAFVVANLDYIFDQTPLVPYEVWLRMESGAKLGPALAALSERNVAVSSVRDIRGERIANRSKPSMEGVFGILSLGFLVSAAVAFIGYLLYWIFTLSRRTVQFGILRATGLGKLELTVMLLAEQLLTTGAAIAAGLAIGRAAGRIFLPFLQEGSPQAPPFAVFSEASDSYRLLMVVLAMLAFGASVLLWHIRRLRVHQAVKLGEER